jgi:hypothetical protein
LLLLANSESDVSDGPAGEALLQFSLHFGFGDLLKFVMKRGVATRKL